MKIWHGLLCLFFVASVSGQGLPAQSLKKNAWNLGVWAQGGTSIQGGIRDVQLLSLGVRVGKVLTEIHGSGPLRGAFEYGVDLIPMTLVFGPDTVYGAGLAPVNLRWNFIGKGPVSPYLEINGGVLLTSSEVPPGTSKINFASGATLGANFFRRAHRSVAVSARFQHISNAGLESPNPGINTVQFSLEYHWFH